MSRGSSPIRTSRSPTMTECERGASTIALATAGELSASPMPVMPSSVETRTMAASCVPLASCAIDGMRR
jgi:hypothetical protein